jgi:hypothetical protein
VNPSAGRDSRRPRPFPRETTEHRSGIDLA